MRKRLTPEILEKNGFVKEIVTSPETNDDYEYYHWNPTPQYPSEGIWLECGERNHYYYKDDIKISYVHQLRQLMRLCGSKKKIEV